MAGLAGDRSVRTDERERAAGAAEIQSGTGGQARHDGEPGGGARKRAQEKGPREDQSSHDVARRWVWTQVEARLRGRGGVSGETVSRRADPRAVDARGRHQIQLL